MDPIEITIYGAVTRGSDYAPIYCPICAATDAHTIRGELDDDTIPVTLTCVNGHDVPVPAEINPREMLFILAMRAE
ncbi:MULTISPECIES: hypothetical protein [unclassified Streptomyces]|uniref:hypothetical protein n=1 Tax=unclassified Streptomyces TaxID=2593676 RepID=UPI000DDB039F|nr:MULTISPECIES: hypothetical protein [unclassified Streptomyces]QZZ26553.1 hypothetical protein A7X85_10050 [Streptomyces sp. ST1015]